MRGNTLTQGVGTLKMGGRLDLLLKDQNQELKFFGF